MFYLLPYFINSLFFKFIYLTWPTLKLLAVKLLFCLSAEYIFWHTLFPLLLDKQTFTLPVMMITCTPTNQNDIANLVREIRKMNA
jgi:hypothetical protein